MITATDAIQLPSATLSDKEKSQLAAAIEKVDAHIRATMTYAGPEPITIPYRDMGSNAVAQALVNAMTAARWNVTINLMLAPSQFAHKNAPPVPHHWQLHIAPHATVYAESQPAGVVLQ